MTFLHKNVSVLGFQRKIFVKSMFNIQNESKVFVVVPC